MINTSLEQEAISLQRRRPWGGGSTDLDWAIDDYLKYCRTIDVLDQSPKKISSQRTIIQDKEFYLVKSAIENVPKFEAGGLAEATINCYVYFLHGLIMHRAYIIRPPRTSPTEEQIACLNISLDYAKLLADDVVALHNKGLIEEGAQYFIEFATRTCFIGRMEDGGLSEEQRIANYQSAKSEILDKLCLEEFKVNQGEQVLKLFEKIVYKDMASGLRGIIVAGPGNNGLTQGIYKEV